MVNGINKFVAKYGDWIFLGAATYRFVFYILDIVSAFKYSGGGGGVKTLFGGLFDMVLYFVLLAAIIGLARKLTGIKGVDLSATMNGGNMQQNPQYPAQQMPMPQNPVQGTPVAPAPAPMAAPVPPVAPAPTATPAPAPVPTAAPANNVWYCSNCGKQNAAETAFCSNCGKPK